MLYTCNACHYIFNTEDYHLPDTPDHSVHWDGRCPDCGKKMLDNKYPAIRKATDEEIREYNKYRKEFAS